MRETNRQHVTWVGYRYGIGCLLFLLCLGIVGPQLAIGQQAIIRKIMNENDKGPGSLRDALLSGGGPFIFDLTGLKGKTIVLDSSLKIRTCSTLKGPGPEFLSISGQNQVRVLEVDLNSNCTAKVVGLTIQEGKSLDGAGLRIRSGGRTELENVVISNNNATRSGGGLEVEKGGILLVKRSRIESNTAKTSGGGILNTGELTLMEKSIVKKNRVGTGGPTTQGGGIFNRDNASLTIEDSQILDNDAGFGGGISTLGSTANNAKVTLSKVIAKDNTAVDGGAIHSSRSILKIDKSVIQKNIAAQKGGGLSTRVGTRLTITDTTIDKNESRLDGGGLHTDASHVLIENSTISQNRSRQGEGGGARLRASNGSSEMINSTISGNAAGKKGGGLSGVGKLYNVSVVANQSPKGSGLAGAFHLFNTIIAQLPIARFTGPNCDQKMIVRHFNLDTDGSCVGNQPAGGDQRVGKIQAGIGPLKLNGGRTQTHDLIISKTIKSPAIDRGNPTGCRKTDQRDQRGEKRAQGVPARCDIGAVEKKLTRSIIDIGTGESPKVPGSGIKTELQTEPEVSNRTNLTTEPGGSQDNPREVPRTGGNRVQTSSVLAVSPDECDQVTMVCQLNDEPSFVCGDGFWRMSDLAQGEHQFTVRLVTSCDNLASDEQATRGEHVLAETSFTWEMTTPEEALASLFESIEAFVDLGVLEASLGWLLTFTLEGAVAHLEQGDLSATLTSLEEFETWVRVFIEAEALPAEVGEELRARSQLIRNGLTDN